MSKAIKEGTIQYRGFVILTERRATGMQRQQFWKRLQPDNWRSHSVFLQPLQHGTRSCNQTLNYSAAKISFSFTLSTSSKRVQSLPRMFFFPPSQLFKKRCTCLDTHVGSHLSGAAGSRGREPLQPSGIHFFIFFNHLFLEDDLNLHRESIDPSYVIVYIWKFHGRAHCWWAERLFFP